ncbi:MAG TPA: TetR/AcrR family transcriptional regulator [Rhizomicrobium sp.]|jgi:AcrR family transcriptional regulator|nr:TetR/AcrR family transcriptional regulator [Rhizomicrobium sp.]
MATTRTYLGASPEERRLARRETLIKAACDVYALRGYRGATVKAICDEAGLTERYFYESFANNEALFLALFQSVCEKMLNAVRAAGTAAAGTPEKKARAILTAYYRGLQAQPPQARVFVIEASDVSPAVHAIAGATFERFTDLLAEAWHGAPMRLDPMLRAGIAGAVVQIARDWIESGFARPVKAVVDAALRISSVLGAALDETNSAANKTKPVMTRKSEPSR